MTLNSDARLKCAARIAVATCASLLAVMLALATGLAPAVAVSSIRVLSYEPNDPSAMFFEPHCNIKLIGIVKAGDLALAQAALDKLRLSPSRAVPPGDDRKYVTGSEDNGYYALCLASDGGDIHEAMRIGELFGEGWMTVVEANDTCASACAILFMTPKRRTRVFNQMDGGAANRPGPGRYLHWSARLGFHAPSLIRPPGSADTLTDETVTQAYAMSLGTLKSIMFKYDLPASPDAASTPPGTPAPPGHDPRKVDEIIDEAKFITNRISGSQLGLDFIPNDLLLALVAVPPGEMFYLSTVGHFLRWGVEPFGLAPPRHVSERMLITGCAHLSYLQCLQGGAQAQCEQLGSSRAYFNARYPLRDEPGLPEETNPPDAYFHNVEKFFVTTKRRLWPPQGRTDTVEAWGFSLIRASLVPASARGSDISHHYCSARLAWRDGKFAAFELAPFNGQRFPDANRKLEFTETEATRLKATPRAGLLTAPYEANSIGLLVRPWVMLPEYRQITDLGKQPWLELEKGGPLATSGPSVTMFLSQPGDNPIDANRLTVAGIAEPGAAIQLLDERDRPVGTAARADAHGYWSAAAPLSRGTGDYVLHAQASNAAGIKRMSRTGTFTVAAPVLTETASTGLTWFNNTYIEGEGDLATVRNVTRQACADRCQANASCAALEFYKPERKCSLFSTVKKTSPDESADVAIRVRQTAALPAVQVQWHENTYIEGDGDLLSVKNSTREACAEKCLTNARCVALEFYKPERKCSLFSATKPQKPDRSADVGLVSSRQR